MKIHEKRSIKPLDFVKTPKGNIAMIKEVNEYSKSDNGRSNQYSIIFLGGGNPNQERNAWWYQSELEVIDNLPSLLARNLIHPFGCGKKSALKYYPI
jgi:hypothetical protein